MARVKQDRDGVVVKGGQTAGLGGPRMMPGGPAGASPADSASDPGASSIFTAVQVLGLKLEPRKTPVDTHHDRPR